MMGQCDGVRVSERMGSIAWMGLKFRSLQNSSDPPPIPAWPMNIDGLLLETGDPATTGAPGGCSGNPSFCCMLALGGLLLCRALTAIFEE